MPVDIISFENKEYVKIKTVSNCKSFARRKSEEFARISWLDVVHSTFLKYLNEGWIYTLAPGITIEFGDHIQRFRMQRARLYALEENWRSFEKDMYNIHVQCVTY